MAKKNKFRSLTVKLLIMLMVSAVAAGIVYSACSFLGRELVDQVWRAPAQSENRLNTHMQSLRDFVEENSVSSTDAASIGQWNRGHRDVRLTVNGRNTILNTDGFTAEITLSDSGLSLRLDISSLSTSATAPTPSVFTTTPRSGFTMSSTSLPLSSAQPFSCC